MYCIYSFILLYYWLAYAIIGGLASYIRLFAEMQADYLYQEAAMTLYEKLDLLLQAIVIIIDIITRLRQRRKKGKRIKK